jgi:hypothetical protein
MKIRIAFAIALLFSAGSINAQQTHTRQAPAPLTREQIRTLQLHDIDETIKEKSHPADEWDVPAEKGSMQSEGLGEGKVGTSYPESEVHAAINPRDTNNIVVSPIHNGGSFYMPIYYTTNFGSTWGKSNFSPKPLMGGITVQGGGDPLFAFDADGKLYYTWIDTYVFSNGSDTTHGVIYWASSTDGGKTWQRSAHDVVTSNWTQYDASHIQIANTTGFDDKQWLAVDRTNSPYHNSLYMAWTKIGKDDAAVMLTVKRAGVDSFSTPVRVSTPDLIKVQYTSIGIDAHGGVHVTFMGSKDRQYYGIYHAYSADGGKTFQAPFKIADADVPNQSFDAVGVTMFGVRLPGNYPCPHLSIDTAHTGNLYMVWNAYGTTDNLGYGSQIYFSRSTDNGTTWSDTVRVNSDPQTDLVIDHFFPTIAVSGDGTITAGWYDRREDPDNNQIGRYYLGVSTDQGAHWANMPVATKPMDFAHVQDKSGGQTYGFGVGEYTQMLVTPNYTIPIWADDRTNDGNLRIYASFIPSSQIFLSSAVAPTQVASVEGGLSLSATYPNPASSIIHSTYQLEAGSHVHASITDARGDILKSLFDQNSSEGQHDFSFDVSQLASGTYYLTLESERGYVSRAFTVSR